MRPVNGSAVALAGAHGADTQDSSKPAKSRGHRREAQGLKLDRNPDQRPPSWPAPRGSAAALDLGAALAGWSRLLGRPPVEPARHHQLDVLEDHTADVNDATAGKVAAMALFNYCNVSMENTEAAFASHPEWRRA